MTPKIDHGKVIIFNEKLNQTLLNLGIFNGKFEQLLIKNRKKNKDEI